LALPQPSEVARHLVAQMLRHVQLAIPPPHTVADVDFGISDWISRLLVKDPTSRTQSAADAREELEELLIGRPRRQPAEASRRAPPTAPSSRQQPVKA
jgi:hypothetical protein